MFTGLVEELGTVEKIKRKGTSLCMTIRASAVLEDIKIGESIAVDGVCLTVTDFSSVAFSVDVVPETVKRTVLSKSRVGERVNLERALKSGDRLGGHLVSGHIDGMGVIREKKRQGTEFTLGISISGELRKYIIPRGSVTIDGVSLTVVKCVQDSFTVAIIPHTAKVTTLWSKVVGSYVNIETDPLGKYVENLMNRAGESPEKVSINPDFLAENGFIGGTDEI